MQVPHSPADAGFSPDHACKQQTLTDWLTCSSACYWHFRHGLQLVPRTGSLLTACDGDAVVSENALRQGRYHTLITSCFSHQAGGHLFSNMFTLYFFGQNLANVVGGTRVSLLCSGCQSTIVCRSSGTCCQPFLMGPLTPLCPRTGAACILPNFAHKADAALCPIVHHFCRPWACGSCQQHHTDLCGAYINLLTCTAVGSVVPEAVPAGRLGRQPGLYWVAALAAAQVEYALLARPGST